MIPVDDLPKAKKSDDRVEIEVDSYKLIDEEEAQLSYLNAEIEKLALQAEGEMFAVPISDTYASPAVIAALKMQWEIGGWTVGVFRVDGGHQVVFARCRGSGTSGTSVTKSLEARDEKSFILWPKDALDPITFEKNKNNPNISCSLLIRMPTRGRPDQALSVLSAYRKLAATSVAIEVVIDEDDEAMNNSQVLQRLCDLDCTITIGRHKSKIDAVNGGRRDDWAILALASDDMVPTQEGYDLRIIEEMDRHFPLRDGAIYFNDGYNKDHQRFGKPVLCTMPIMGRYLWEQFGYVYYPEYGSLYSDDEQTEVLMAIKRLAFIDEVIVEHRHHAAGKAPHDALYTYNDKKWGRADRELFEARQQRGFDMPPMWLSILICSTEARAPMLHRLVDHLRSQMRVFERQVEICVSIDNGTKLIGDKRNELLQRAVGDYVAFIDDDDWVSYDYVARVVAACREGKDCTSLVGVLTTDGERPERFEHSLTYESWYIREDGVHVRTPNHLNAVRRELALKAGFTSKNFSEDHDYSMALKPLLQSQAFTGAAPLYYYWFRSKK